MDHYFSIPENFDTHSLITFFKTIAILYPQFFSESKLWMQVKKLLKSTCNES